MRDTDDSAEVFQQHPIRRIALGVAILALVLPPILWLVIPPIGPQFVFRRFAFYPLQQALSVVVPLLLASALLVSPERYRPAYWILVLGFGLHLLGGLMGIIFTTFDPSAWTPLSGWISYGVTLVAFVLLLLGGIMRPPVPPPSETLSQTELRT